MEGADMCEIAMEVKSYQALRFAEKFKYYCMEDRMEPPIIYWRWGPSGVGKTRWAFDTFGYGNVYMKDGSKWWDGYDQQKCILIDDFEGASDFRQFLRVLDRYPYQSENKGGYIKLNSPYIVITSEFPPAHFWKNNELYQVVRRIEDHGGEIVKVDTDT